VLTISSPLGLSSTPSSVNSERLLTSPAEVACTKQLDVIGSPAVSHCVNHELISPSFPSSVDHKLPTSSPQRRHLPQHPQQISSSRISAMHTSVPQQLAYSPQNEVGRAVVGTSQSRMTPEAQHCGIHQTNAPPFTNNVEKQLPSNPPHDRHLPSYPLKIFDSRTGPTYACAPQQPAVSQHSNVQMPQAVIVESPNRVVSGTGETAYSRIMQRTGPIRSIIPPDEQPLVRPSLSPNHGPVTRQYFQPTGNHSHYRNQDSTRVSYGLDPYRQQMLPPAAQFRVGLSTSDLHGMHQQKTANRSSSWRQYPPTADHKVVYMNRPAAPTQRSSSQRETFVVGSEKGQYGEKMPLFANGPSPRRQHTLMHDPYQMQYPPVERTSHIQHDRVSSGPVPFLSRDNLDRSMQNRVRTGVGETVTDYAAVRAAGVPASHRLSPATRVEPQYSGPMCRGQPNNELYPSTAYFVENSQRSQPLPPTKHQPRTEQRVDDWRNPLTELQYIHTRQVCTVHTVL